jgi:hypothetical protein
VNAFAWFVLIAYLPISIGIYRLLPPRQAFLWVIFGGVLFLPLESFKLSILADYGKASAPAYSALLCTLIFYPHFLLRYRLKWFDLPMLGWIIWQFPPSLANGYGLHDGAAQAVDFATVWAVPYFLTRCYFTRPRHLREVALALVGAGLIYLPLCLFEVRMSPSLHLWIYGTYPSPFFDMVRLGGYRPVVFMRHGLMLAFFMCSAAFVAGWLWWFWREPGPKKVGPVPIAWAALGLVPMAILTRSAGAIMIFACLAGLVLLSRGGKWKWLLVIPVVIMPIYIGTRTAEITDGRFMLDVTKALFKNEQSRASSLIARLTQEDNEISKIRQKPWTGWSNWSPGQDQLWLLLARNTGLPTTAMWLATFSLPLVLVLNANLKKCRDLFVFGVPLALVLVGWTMDGLFNGMFHPIWSVVAAAVMTAATNTAADRILTDKLSRQMNRDSMYMNSEATNQSEVSLRCQRKGTYNSVLSP